MTTSALFGERYLSKVGAVFAGQEQAKAAVDRVSREGAIERRQIYIIEPGSHTVSHKLHPETRGIGKTLAKSHLTLGLGGLILGMILGLVLVGADIALFASSPGYTLAVFSAFGAVAGLLLAGLIALRPDQDPLAQHARRAAGSGNWMVIVQARDHDQEHRAKDLLQKESEEVVSTF